MANCLIINTSHRSHNRAMANKSKTDTKAAYFNIRNEFYDTVLANKSKRASQ
jgi:hypothetical protein